MGTRSSCGTCGGAERLKWRATGGRLQCGSSSYLLPVSQGQQQGGEPACCSVTKMDCTLELQAGLISSSLQRLLVRQAVTERGEQAAWPVCLEDMGPRLLGTPQD